MLYCKNCGKVNLDDAKFCAECGCSLLENNEHNYHVENKVVYSELKCWSVFANVGFIVGLVSFIVSFFGIFGLCGFIGGIYGLVFSILGKKTRKIYYREKADKGLGFSFY